MRSAAAASRCPASSSAAATSAGSARRPRSSARASPRTRRTRCSTRPGRPGSRRSTPPTPTAAAAASPIIGSWLRAQGAEVRERIVLTTKTFNPMGEGADPASPRRESGGSSRRASSGSGSTRSTSISPTRWTRRDPGRGDGRRLRGARRGGIDPRLRRQQRRRRVARGSAPLSGRPRLGAELVLAARREDDEAGVLPIVRTGGPRLHAVQPARRRLADGEVPARRGAAGRLPDDAAARALPAPRGRSRLRRARGVRGDARASAATSPAALAIAWLLGASARHGRRRRARAGPTSSSPRSRRSSSTSPRPSTSSSRRCSHERAGPRRARGAAAAADGRVHRGDGGGAALAGARRAAPAAAAGDAAARARRC